MGNNTGEIFERLVNICAKLRGENGCLWDKEQTHKSLRPYLEEESGEVADAIKNNNIQNLKEELGDLLYQIIFHSQIAQENKDFTIDEVVKNIIDKIIRRHPHIFGNTKVSSVNEIIKNWEEIKRKEKK